MRRKFPQFTLIGCVLVLTGLSGCATIDPAIEKQQAQEALLNRASYDQILPAIESIHVGDAMSKVLEIAIPKDDVGSVFRITNHGQFVKYIAFPMWPGVLTPFLGSAEYVFMRMNDYKGNKLSSAIKSIHFGYLEGMMLRPRRIVIFENEKVSKIIDNPDVAELAKEPGASIAKVEPLDYLRKKAFEDNFLPNVEQIKPGMDIWEVFSVLKASYVLTSDAQLYVTICPSLLNYKRSLNVEKTPEGNRIVYPFGYMESDTEMVKWDVETLNNRVVSVRAHI